MQLKKTVLETPLGPMVAVGERETICFLDFADRHRNGLEAGASSGDCPAFAKLEGELRSFFKGELRRFETKVAFAGTPFQKRVWEELLKIPYGSTRSYGDIARAIGKPSACRAAAQANGANPIAILIPCHRVIQTDGALGGYSGGVWRKQKLLELEFQ